ncbi:MAG: GGDEF domain-containing protein [Arcobacter sp.]|uniref:GGDEF domain-containing protein n=1 Tax=Arcobacter sp. TaxID=1872629 RepID=UPI003B001CEF
MKKNIIVQFLILLILVAIFITGISLYNLRTVSIKSSVTSAESISEVIKSGLDLHIKNNSNVDEFLKSVSSMKNVKDLWLVKSEFISSQFENSKFKNPKDELDKDVLRAGQTKYLVSEGFINTNVRVTIPYNANITCLSCHNVKEGQTLGAISIVLDVSTLKEIGIRSIYVILTIILLAVIMVFLFSKKVFNPYFSLYTKLRDNINQAKIGKFINIEIPRGLSSEVVQVTKDYNNLITIFKDTSLDIDEKLQGFVGYRDKTTLNTNPLNESKDIIDNLSNLYQFKKQVELDNTKNEIYNRIAQVFENKFNLKNFTFFEIDIKKQKMEKIISVGESLYCYDSIKDSPHLCRAARTKSDVISIDFHESCPFFNKKDKFYYCLNIDIIENLYLIVHFVTDTKEELEEIKNKSLFISRFLKEARPTVEVKLLMQALEESAFRDGLTQLYNRKFLDENLKILIPQIKRDKKKIGLLMLDMDHFKAVNDEYGHDIGDKVLKELSRILEENVRESDILVRYGGEEFMVLLIGVDSEESALAIAHKIGAKVRENEIDVYAGTTIKKTISMGLSMFPEDSSSFETVVKNADIALYEAKSNGRDKVVRYTKEQKTSVELF